MVAQMLHNILLPHVLATPYIHLRYSGIQLDAAVSQMNVWRGEDMREQDIVEHLGDHLFKKSPRRVISGGGVFLGYRGRNPVPASCAMEGRRSLISA